MTRMTYGVSALIQRGSVRPPGDTLEFVLCTRCLPAPPPLNLYLHTDGVAIGRVDILSLRRLMLAQHPEAPLTRPHGAVIFATGPDDVRFFLDTTGTLSAGAGTVWGYSINEPTPELIAPTLDDFLVSVISTEIAPWPQHTRPLPTRDLPVCPSRHGAVYAERLGQALHFMPNARASARYALRRASALPSPARERVLTVFGDGIADQLASAYARDVVTDSMMDRVIANMVEPFIERVQRTSQDRSHPSPANHTHQLREALLVGSLGDLGEHFCEQSEHHLYGFISEYLALLDLNDRDAPLSPVELEVHLRALDHHLDGLDASPDDLLASLPRAPHRDGAARAILEPLGYAWLLDHASP